MIKFGAARGNFQTMPAETKKSAQVRKPMTAGTLRRKLNTYGPFIGAGVRVTRVTEDFRTIEVEMPLRASNKNLVGTHFGGSLYSMVDPFYMIMLIQHLGPEYIVWDKAATIRFRKPGLGTVRATFQMPEERVEEIRAQAEREEKVEPRFQVIVTDAEGNVVAEVEKLLWVAKKKAKK
jgi:hypothetical protein